jgi:hypothetical protein
MCQKSLPHSFQQRVKNLTGVASNKFGKRLNGNFFLVPATVQSDEGGNRFPSRRALRWRVRESSSQSDWPFWRHCRLLYVTSYLFLLEPGPQIGVRTLSHNVAVCVPSH